MEKSPQKRIKNIFLLFFLIFLFVISLSQSSFAKYDKMTNCCDVDVIKENIKSPDQDPTFSINACKSEFEKIYTNYQSSLKKYCDDANQKSIISYTKQSYNANYPKLNYFEYQVYFTEWSHTYKYSIQNLQSLNYLDYQSQTFVNYPDWIVNQYESSAPMSHLEALNQWRSSKKQCEQIIFCEQPQLLEWKPSYQWDEAYIQKMRDKELEQKRYTDCTVNRDWDKYYECIGKFTYSSCWALAYYGINNDHYQSTEISSTGYVEDAMYTCNRYLTKFYDLGIIVPKKETCTNVAFDGCCEGWQKTKHEICCKPDEISILDNNKKPICVPNDTFPIYTRTEIDLDKKKMNLNGDDYIDVTFKFYGKDENGKEVKIKNHKVPSLYAQEENNLDISSIIGNTEFNFELDDKINYADESGNFKTKIKLNKVELGEEANRISEVKIFVYTSEMNMNDENKEDFFTLEVPKMRIEKIYKETKTHSRPGAYNAYVIEFDDKGNLEKTIFLTANGGTFKYGEDITKDSKIKITTRENRIVFGWAPPIMTNSFRINQIETLKKQLEALKDDAIDHYKPDIDEYIEDKLTSYLPEMGQKGKEWYDKAEETKEHLDSVVETTKQMKEDYFAMFEEDATLTEGITRGFLMTTDAYEMTDGTISLIQGEDETIKDVIKSRAIEALKESLRNELMILEAAKGKEAIRFYNLNIDVKAGGARDSRAVKLTSEEPILTYEGS
jgi:hypothetical protein